MCGSSIRLLQNRKESFHFQEHSISHCWRYHSWVSNQNNQTAARCEPLCVCIAMCPPATHSLTTTGTNKKRPSCQHEIKLWHFWNKVLQLLTDLSFISWRWVVIIYPRAAQRHTDSSTSPSVTESRCMIGRWALWGGGASLQTVHSHTRNLTGRLTHATVHTHMDRLHVLALWVSLLTDC